MSLPKQIDPVAVAIGSVGDVLMSSTVSDSTNWNVASQWKMLPVMQSEMQLGDQPDSFVRFAAPPPNFVRRLIWKWALGVTWKDLRPEKKLDELGKLK